MLNVFKKLAREASAAPRDDARSAAAGRRRLAAEWNIDQAKTLMAMLEARADALTARIVEAEHDLKRAETPERGVALQLWREDLRSAARRVSGQKQRLFDALGRAACRCAAVEHAVGLFDAGQPSELDARMDELQHTDARLWRIRAEIEAEIQAGGPTPL